MSRRAIRIRRFPRRDAEPLRVSVAKGVATLALCAGVIYLAASFYDGVPLRDYGTLYVEAPEVGNLIAHDPVRIAGVRVGQVVDVAATRGGNARVRLQIEAGTRISADSTAALRANGLLGSRYVQVIPGRSPQPLANGATIRVPDTALTYGVPEVLDVFDAPTRSHLGTAVRELGTGMFGRGAQLNAGVRQVAGAVVPFRRFAQTVLRPPGAVERLIPALNDLMTPLDAARSDLAGAVRSGADAFRPLITENRRLDETLTELPRALGAARAGTSAAQRLLVATRKLATAVNRTLPAAPRALRATSRLLRDGRAPLRATHELLVVSRSSVPAATRTVRAVGPTLERLRVALDDLVPMTTEVGRYGCDIANFALVFRSVTGFGGYGSGPNGPPMAFRMQLVPAAPAENTGSADSSGLVHRESYPVPCRYLGTRYPRLTQQPVRRRR